MIAKTEEDIAILREGGKRLAFILRSLAEAAVPGAHTKDLDLLAEKLVREGGDTPALKGYHPRFAKRPYPSTVCISVNDEVVHGIPSENNVVLKEGDIVGFDLVIEHKGLFIDSAVTVPVGEVSEEAKQLLSATKEALMAGIGAARAGGRLSDISAAIENVGVLHGYGVVYELGGHGVGRAVHEEPMIPNFGDPGKGPKLEKGMVLALEPMFNVGAPDVVLDADDYTYRTKDGSLSAHFEHSILITEDGAEILTTE